MIRRNPQARLEDLRSRVQQWRALRVKHEPMPAQLWAEATALAREVGVNTVRGAAQLDYGALSKRLREADAAEPGTSVVSTASSTFIELPVAWPSTSAQTVVEFTEATGARMTIRLAPGSAVDFGRLVEAFRRSGR